MNTKLIVFAVLSSVFLWGISIYNGWLSEAVLFGSSTIKNSFEEHISVDTDAETIGYGEFAYKLLTHIDIPDSVTVIGNRAFIGNKLSRITIPPDVTSIGTRTFAINRLENITIPPSVTSIGTGAFAINRLRSITIESNVSLAKNSFGSGFDNVYKNNNRIAGTYTRSDTRSREWSIWYDDFSYVNSNGNITITGYKGTNRTVVIPSEIHGNPVTGIGEHALRAKTLTGVTIPNSVTVIGDYALALNQLTSVTIPANVTSIGNGAFCENNLASITIPNSVTSIGETAFSQNQLTSVTIPNNVTFIGEAAFSQNRLTSVTISNNVTFIGNSVFQENQLTSVTIPASITTIGDQAFYKNRLTSVVIPNSVTSIGNSTFRENQLASITIPNSVISIGETAFSQNRLTSVTMGNSVTSIGEGVFRDNRLTSVVIPNSVTSIGGYAFNDNNLWSITIGEDVKFPPDEVEVFGTLGFLTAYRNNDRQAGTYTRSNANSTNWTWATPFQWAQAGSRITITGHIGSGGVMVLPAAINGIPVTAIGNGAFRDKNLTRVVIPDGVISIGEGAFASNRLTSVALGANVTFGSDAFDSGLESAYNNNGMAAGTYTRPDAVSTAWAAVPVPSGFVRIPSGIFTMGSPASEPERDNDEGPQRQVTVSAFYIGQNPVTVGEFRRFMSAARYRTEAESGGDGQIWTGSSWETKAKANWKNPGFTQGQDYPVVLVSWNDAVRYCNWLSQQERLTPAYTISGTDVIRNRNANGYRLPTEAEWEYACRAGTRTPFNTGNNITTDEANYHGTYPYNNNAQGVYRERTTPVGSFEPNAWGLYDMHGNVYEWCWDWYGSYSSTTVQTDPAGPVSGEKRVTRGGNWSAAAQKLRSAYRGTSAPSDRSNDGGFRVVRP